MFNSIDIEINSNCNFKCPYCPNHKYSRLVEYMDKNLFAYILKQLGDLGFNGRVSPNLYNEPTLHPRFVEYMEMIKKNVPDCKLVVYSNGSRLGSGMYYRMHGIVDEWKVTKHPEFKRQFFVKSPQSDIFLRKFDETYILHNRCGTVDHPLAKKKPDRCFADLDAMYVNFKGDVVVCCNDFKAEHTVGNAMEEPLHDLWLKAEHEKKKIRNGDFDNPACKKCNCVTGE